MLYEQGFDAMVLNKMCLPPNRADLSALTGFLNAMHACTHAVSIAIVGKYTQLPDAYLSVIEALKAAGVSEGAEVNVTLIDGEELDEDSVEEALEAYDGIVVPGGFGNRAFEGKMATAGYARQHNVPFLGICLGMQAAVCEFARNVASIKGATSAEFEQKADNPVIDLMPSQAGVTDKGATMRLGAYPCDLMEGTKVHEAYGAETVWERHRHRFEVNNDYRKQLMDAGLTISGVSPDERLVEMIELSDLDWFVGTQSHPEFKSRPTRPHPLFKGLIHAAVSRQHGLGM